MRPEVDDEIRVVSYNIHKGLDAASLRVVLSEIRGALHRVAPDLVLIQEVVGAHLGFERRFHDWPEQAQFEYLADQMWPHYAYGRNAVYSGGHHGNAILSRYPIQSWENIDISTNPWERRGILHATVNAPRLGVPLHVCCTHLNLTHGQRRRQVAALCSRIRDAVPAASPLVIGGDFNDWRTWVTRALRQAIGVEEAYFVMEGRHPRTYPGWRPVLPLDRIYVRGLEIREARVLDGPTWRRLSDHLGLEVALAAPAA